MKNICKILCFVKDLLIFVVGILAIIATLFAIGMIIPVLAICATMIALLFSVLFLVSYNPFKSAD